MADLEDLGIPSITELSNDEGIELIRQIRLRRRTPTAQTKKQKTSGTKKVVAKAKVDISKMSDADKLELLKLLGE